MAIYLLLKAKKGDRVSGAKYYKRTPKAGGGYKYFYTKEQYKKHIKDTKGLKKKISARIKSRGAKKNKRTNDIAKDSTSKNKDNQEDIEFSHKGKKYYIDQEDGGEIYVEEQPGSNSWSRLEAQGVSNEEELSVKNAAKKAKSTLNKGYLGDSGKASQRI